eukprot:CAMPEP_0194195088 /NCGR_PEP_ID=MMETSP0154-20130528/75938_1 /TAXON_ID=1049557 /ORGANISM="Thalassiothrix antarctica, Strain L6-D1" /LENGTH=156 /DNA_ID=CAMNT_0038919575 /DNA_START=230 /DNA_END=700 /DNA_ORIENTATION=-
MVGRLNAALNQTVTLDSSIDDVLEHFVYIPRQSPVNPQDIPNFLSTRLADNTLTVKKEEENQQKKRKKKREQDKGSNKKIKKEEGETKIKEEETKIKEEETKIKEGETEIKEEEEVEQDDDDDELQLGEAIKVLMNYEKCAAKIVREYEDKDVRFF